jgi:hypothetical protein
MTKLAKPFGKVSGHLLDTIRRQINQNGIVVWYDPQCCYKDFLDSLPAEELPGIPVERYDGSFLALRHRIEPLLSAEERPRLLIYIPMEREKTKNALIEAEAAGVILQPGARPLIRNTRLSVVAKAILRECAGAERLRKIEKDVEEGKISLAELDRIAEDGTGVTGPVLEIIFKTKVPGEMALLFLSGQRFDEEILKRGALPDLCCLLSQEFELPVGEESKPEDLRQRFARFVLTAELLSSLSERPSALASVSMPSSQACQQACISLAETWRSRRELGGSYRNLSERVSQDIGLSRMQLSPIRLQNIETFLESDKSLQSAVATQMHQVAKEDLVQMARQRQEGFWSIQIPEVKARWELIAAAGELLWEAQRIECELKLLPESSRAFFDAYTSGEHPWLLLDTAQRHMDQLYHNLDLKDIDDLLERLVLMARQRYMDAGSALSERFLRLYQKDRFQIQGALRQAEIFDKKVRPSLDEGKTVYIWVDALRLEMAHRLAHILSDEFEVEITPAIAEAPTVTEIGMASLLPGAKECKVVPAGEGRLALEIGGTMIKSRPDRMRYLEGFAKNSGLKFFECLLDDLLPKPKNSISKDIIEADLIVVTSQEIDELCESDNLSLARSSMGDLLRRLQGVLRILSGLGLNRFILTADHGYIFGEELGEDMKIDPPGGETLDLTRRAWVGRGGTADSSYLRLRLSDLGQVGDLEMAVPWRFACFRVKGGARAYFHGGLSPQELIVPVLTLTSLRKEQENVGEIVWSLNHASKVTTRVFLVTITGRAKNFQPLVPPVIRLELWDGNTTVSEISGASYGFIKDTNEVKLTTLSGDPYGLAPNVVTLRITKIPACKKLSLHLIDVRTEIEQASEKELDAFIQEY